MAVQTAKSGVLAKLGDKLRKAHREVRSNEVRYSSGGDLPEINLGVAQLVECKIDQYKSGDNKDQYFFYAAGIVKEPKESNGIPVEGLRTSIMEPLCETPKSRTRKTIAEHWDNILNELKKLGLEVDGVEADDVINDLIPALKESKPHFRFRTWAGQPTKEYPNPRINHDWKGVCDYEVNGDTDDGVVDETAEEVEEEVADVEETVDETVETEEVAGDYNADEDVAALGAAADEGDNDAIERLDTLARSLDIEPDNIPSWSEVAEQIVALQSVDEEAAEAEEEIEEESVAVKVGDVYTYGLSELDPKTKKVKTRKVEVEILSVNADAQTVTLKSLDTGKTILGGNKKPLQVSWENLKTE